MQRAEGNAPERGSPEASGGAHLKRQVSAVELGQQVLHADARNRAGGGCVWVCVGV